MWILALALLQDEVTFGRSPLDPDDILHIVPLGNLNPPDHTLPTDHLYLCWRNASDRRSESKPALRRVVAPAAGTVIAIRGQEDSKIQVQVTPDVRYYLDHVIVDASIKVGAKVEEGTVLGTTSPRSVALDLGVVNRKVTLTGFANPKRYTQDSLHCDKPLRYFVEPIRKKLYAKVRREGSDKDGKIDYDIPGRLVGGWFLEGLSVKESAGRSGWEKHLAFVYSPFEPDLVRISIGGVLSLTGLYSVAKDAPDPATITAQSGTVIYALFREAERKGILIVRMVDASTIRVETVADPAATAGTFTSEARTYIR